MSGEASLRRATPLAERLQARIREHGPVSVADYMQACLQDAEHGYYRRSVTVGRDFVTAPEISQVFGELIGLWCAVTWQQMGQPNPVHLVELGPGRGTMMRDMLRALRLAPDFLAAATVHLVESSASLTDAQRSLLQGAHARMCWHSDPRELPQGACIVVGNEFVDTLPARQFVRGEQGWAERVIAIDAQSHLQFATMPCTDAMLASLSANTLTDTRAGEIVEVQDFTVLTHMLTARPVEGPLAALLIDYGHVTTAAGDTLQAVRESRYEHPLASPGEADLTVQVDFAALARALSKPGTIAIDGPITQAELLGALGAAERASRLMHANPAQANAIEMGVQRLLAPAGMGGRVKAIGIRSAALPPLPGFSRSSPERSMSNTQHRGD